MKHPHLITIWKLQGTDWHGNATFSSPVKKYVRWEDQQKLYITENGTESRGRSVIYCDTPIADFGDYLFLGDSDDASPPDRSYTVKDVRNITNISGTRTEYRVIV